MRYGLHRDAVEKILNSIGFEKHEDRSKPPRLLEFSNASPYQAGAKGVIWRALDRVDSFRNERAWIQVRTVKPDL